MLIGAHVVEAADVYIYIRDEYPIAARDPGPRDRQAAAGRPAAPPAPRRRRLYLRRGILADREHRGQARPAAPQAALPVPGRPVRPPDPDQQCRDAVLGARPGRARRGLVEEPRRATAAWACAPTRSRAGSKEPGVKLAPAGITVRELIDEYLRRHGRGAHASRPTCPAAPRAASCRPRWATSRSISARSRSTAASSARPPSSSCRTRTTCRARRST